ncbi:hypothetical protein B0T20DRAFT_494505 [Sordaria brevicollis]|uniref:Uncharacterized protein n=1 Tax=Sordaria brevicollis TaxID=83679 RepID=A0AAE0UDY7_SORBR|nr:hypothetical protein B0T20DRAFT_494505 [Sordaria brevicollis]
MGHRRQAAVVTLPGSQVSDDLGFFEAWFNAEAESPGMFLTHARVTDEPAPQAEEADDKATVDSRPRATVAPTATVDVSCESRAKTDPTGGPAASTSESAADDKVADELPQQAVSPVATTLPVPQLDSTPGPVGIRTTTAGRQDLGAEAAAGNRSGSMMTSLVSGGERPLGVTDSTQTRPCPPPLAPWLDPARLSSLTLSEKRRMKAERAKEGCSQGHNSAASRTTSDPLPLSLPAVSGLSGPVVEDTPSVPPQSPNLSSPSVVPAGGRAGQPLYAYTGRFAGSPGSPPPNRPLPPIPGQSIAPLGTQVQRGEERGAMEYEGRVVEGSEYEDSDRRQLHHSGGRPRLYSPSLPTIRDSSPASLASVVRVTLESSSSTPGTAGRSSSTAVNEDDLGAQLAPEESLALRGDDDTTLEADTSFVQGDRRRWGMVPQMLDEEARLRLMASSPTPSSDTDSDRTVRPCPREGREEEAPPATDSLVEDVVASAIDNSAVVTDFGESVPSWEGNLGTTDSLANPLAALPPMVEVDLVPAPLRRAPAVRRGSSASTSPQPQQRAASRSPLYVFPRPPMGMGLRADAAGGSSTERPGTAPSSGDGGLVSDRTVGTNSPRSQHVALAMSSEAAPVVPGPSGAAQTAVMSSGAVTPTGVSAGAGLGRGLLRSVTHSAIPPPPVPESTSPVGFARSATQALPRLPMSTTVGGALGGNSRSDTRAVSAPRPMGAPTGTEDVYDADFRVYFGRTRDGYQDQRAVLRPAGLLSRTQTSGALSSSTTGGSGSTPDITLPPTSSSGRGSGSRQLSGSGTFVGSPSSQAVMSPQTPGFSSPSFASAAVSSSGDRGRGRGRGSRGSNSSARSGQPQPQTPQPQPKVVVDWNERGPALKTVRTSTEEQELRNEPAEEPRSYWSSDTESEPSTMGRMRNAFNRLRSKSRGNLRREANSSVSTSASLGSLASRESGPREEIPPVPALPASLSREVSASSAVSASAPLPSPSLPPPAPPASAFSPPLPPLPPVPAEEDDDEEDANRASGSQRQKQLKKKKSLGNLFGRRRDE